MAVSKETQENLNSYKTFLTENRDKIDEVKFNNLSKDLDAFKSFQETGNLPDSYFKSPVTTDLEGKLSTGFTPLDVAKDDEQTGFDKEITDIKVDAPKTQQTTQETIQEQQKTGIDVLDTEIDKLRIEKENKIKETVDNYNIARGRAMENKNLYTNFDEVNKKAENVLEDIRNAQSESGTDLTPEQINQIAIKNGVSVDEVNNPGSILNQLQFTDEGKEKFGLGSAERNIQQRQTNFERAKADLERNLQQQTQDLDLSIADARRRLSENVAWAEATGAWSGAGRSSAYERGINNMKDEGQRVIQRLQTAKSRLNSATEENIKRLTADYELAQKEAKQTLDRQMESVKFDSGMQMIGLEDKYGKGSKELTKALDAIAQEFGTKSLKVMDDYLASVERINRITNDKLDQEQRFNDLVEQKANKRYNDLLANDGLLINNTSLTDIVNGLNRGEYTEQQYSNIKNIMNSSIVQTLAQKGTVDENDLTLIDKLLDEGMTPTQIVARMGQKDKFKKAITEQKPQRIDLGGGRVRIINPDGTSEDYQDGELITPDASQYYSDFRITQNVGDKSPNSRDTGYNGGTPGIDFAMPVGTDVKSTVSGVVVDRAEDKDYGTQIIIEDSEGNQHMYSHLSEKLLQPGDQVKAGDIIALSGNTGFSTGPHLDYRVRTSEGEWINPNQFLTKKDTKLTKAQEDTKSVILSQINAKKASPSDITKFTQTAVSQGWGDELSRAISATGDKAIAEEFNKKIKEAGGDVLKIMEASAGGKSADQNFRNSFEKGITVISQLDSLSNQIFTNKDEVVKDENGEDIDISPLTGWARKRNPWDTDAATIESTLTAIVPNLARGVYGEVGVLTDQDVELYKKTIPNLNQTDDVKKAVLALTLRTVKNSLDNKIKINASTGVDMSGLTDFYSRINDRLNDLESEIGITGTETVIDTKKPVTTGNFDNIFDRIK